MISSSQGGIPSEQGRRAMREGAAALSAGYHMGPFSL